MVRKESPHVAGSMVEKKEGKSFSDLGRLKQLIVIGLFMLPALLLVVAAEWLANAVVVRTIELETAEWAEEPVLYRMVFGKGPFRSFSETPLNQLGFPDREWTDTGSKGGCVHVLFLGDSFLFGDAVDRHRNFFSLVQQRVGRERPEQCIRLFNAGQRMTTIQEQSAVMEQAWELVSPDVVVVVQYQNDLTDLTNPGNVAHLLPPPVDAEGNDEARGVWWGEVMRNRVPFGNAALVRLLLFRAFEVLIVRGIEYDMLDQWSVVADPQNSALAENLMGHYQTMFSDVVRRAEARGAEVGTIIIPSKLDIMAGRYPEEEFFVRIANEEGLPCLPVFDQLAGSGRPYRFQRYDGHLSVEGNHIVADAVYSWMFGPEGVFLLESAGGADGTDPSVGVGVTPSCVGSSFATPAPAGGGSP